MAEREILGDGENVFARVLSAMLTVSVEKVSWYGGEISAYYLAPLIIVNITAKA